MLGMDEHKFSVIQSFIVFISIDWVTSLLNKQNIWVRHISFLTWLNFMMPRIFKFCFSPFLCKNSKLQLIMASYSQKPVPEWACQDGETFPFIILIKFKWQREAVSSCKIFSPLSGLPLFMCKISCRIKTLN